MSIGKRKSVQAVLVLLIVVAIILAGAFAWYSFTQSALNIFDGFTNPGVNVHDRYPEKNGQEKEVYVENSGERPLYIRVRFEEFMNLNGKPIDINETGDISKPDDGGWHIHSYEGVPYVCGEEYHNYYTWVMGSPEAEGDPNDGWIYYLPAPFSNLALFDAEGNQVRNPKPIGYEHSITDEEYSYYGKSNATTANYNNKDVTDKYLYKETIGEAYIRIETTLNSAGSTPGQTVRDELAALYTALDALPANDRVERNKAQKAIDDFLLANKLGYWDLVYDVVDKEYNDSDKQFNEATDLENGRIEFVPLKRTLQTEMVYTMSQWIAMGTPSGQFWVMDNDGWCYWAELLMPGQSTGLLLSQVLLDKNNPPSGVWEYAINIRLEAVDFEDYLKGTFGIEGAQNPDGKSITEQGQMVLDAVSGKYVFDIVNPNTTSQEIHTYVNNKDNTYRELYDDGSYGPLFVYLGDIPPLNNAIVDASVGNNPYAVGSTFLKNIPGEPAPTEFKIVAAGYGSEGTASGIIEGKDGRRYIMLEYTKPGDTEPLTAWLATGSATNKFEPLGTPATSPDVNILIWSDSLTSDPSLGTMRQSEGAEGTVKIGDVYEINSVEWLVLARGSGLNDGKTLIITKDVVDSALANGGITSALAGYNTNGTNGIATTTPATATLLTIQDTIDYFANNAARAASETWWLSDGYIAGNGAPTAVGSTTEHHIRPAVWVDSDELQVIISSLNS